MNATIASEGLPNIHIGGVDYAKYADVVINYATEYGIKLISAVLIFMVGRMIAKSLAGAVRGMMMRYSSDETLTHFVMSGVYYGLLIVVIMAAISELGIQTTSFMAILGAAGLAIGLALKDTLSNIGAAVVILVFRPFRIGDLVDAAGVSGTVDQIGLFTTTISPLDNRTVIVPNSAITAGNITNFSSKPIRRVDHAVGISYNDDIKKAKEIMYKAIKADRRTLEEPAPLVAVSELGDSSVNFVVRAWVKSEEYWDVHFDLIESVKIALDDGGITIPYPQMDVHMDQSNP